jgi:hypothetical protein
MADLHPAEGVRPSQRVFRIGRVVVNTLRVYFRQFLYVNVTMLVVWLPLIAAGVMLNLIEGNRTYFGDFARWELAARSARQAVGGAAILLILLYPICAAIIFHIAFRTLRDGKTRFLTSVARGFARGFYVILTIILIAIVIAAISAVTFKVISYSRVILARAGSRSMYSLLATLLPGYLGITWSVALPACVVEGLGPIASLARSRRLTQGYRWRILAVVLIFAALLGLLYFPLEALVPPLGSWWGGLIVLVCMALGSAFAFVIPAAIYHELRHAKEGRDIQSLAAVFD